jgi:hypothetical protein
MRKFSPQSVGNVKIPSSPKSCVDMKSISTHRPDIIVRRCVCCISRFTRALSAGKSGKSFWKLDGSYRNWLPQPPNEMESVTLNCVCGAEIRPTVSRDLRSC